MKQVMVVALVLCMLLPVISYAQVDLASMTDMDLMQLQADLVDELFTRGKEATIPVGKYIVGQHIPAGDYFIAAGVSSGTWVEVNDEPGGYGDHYQLHVLQSGESVGLLVLRDGDTLDVRLGEAKFIALSGSALLRLEDSTHYS